MAEEEGLVRYWNCLWLGQNEPVVEVVENADSHLSQRGESHIHALRKSARSQGQPKWADLVLICHPFECESQESSEMGGYLDVKVCVFLFFGDEEVAAVEAWLALGWTNDFYGSPYQQIHYLCAQDLSVLSAHCGGDHTAEALWSLSELEWITSSHCSHYPLWHTGDGLPGLGPCGKRLNRR